MRYILCSLHSYYNSLLPTSSSNERNQTQSHGPIRKSPGSSRSSTAYHLLSSAQHKEDGMARTKTKPPPRDSWGLPPRRLVADPGSPRTPGGQGVRYAAQQSAYPTPDTPTKSKSTSEDRAQQQQLVKDEDRTQYGRWSSSGRSWVCSFFTLFQSRLPSLWGVSLSPRIPCCRDH